MAILQRFSLYDGNYYFRIRDNGGIDHEEFDRAVELIKQWIPLKERRWDSKFWEIKATEENKKKLSAIFENGRRCINKEKVKSLQLRMF